MGIPDDDSPQGGPRPSYWALEQEVVSLRAALNEASTLIQQMSVELAELRAERSTNSRNSSKPPSSDGYAKPAPKSRRVRSGKKPGKQPGDPGHHLATRADPDLICVHAPTQCRSCGSDLAGVAASSVVARQVFDLPPMSLVCTEHQAETRRCRCGVLTTGSFPDEASAPACYGPGLRALVCYLVARQHLPVARVAELLADTYGAPVSTGAIVAMVRQGAGKLDLFCTLVRELLRGSPVVHCDETGLRVNARLHWVHAASSTDLTLYHLDPRRGKEALENMGVIQGHQGVLVHDGWPAYRSGFAATHALCNAHHLRELEAIAALEGQGWAADMADLLTGAWHQVLSAKDGGREHLDRDQLAAIRTRYAEIIDAAHRANPPPVTTSPRPKRSKALALLTRLDYYADDILRFAADFSVPFDNNLCERDVRMIKIAQKVSGGFRSTEGAAAFLALRSYLSTAGKQGVNRLGALQRLYLGDPWMPTLPIPG